MQIDTFSPKAFLFDMDGLLLDTERLFMKSFVEMAADYDVPADKAEAFFITLVGSSADKTTGALEAFFPAPFDLTAFDTEWRKRHAKNIAKGLPIKPFAKELLTALKATGKPIGLVTSTKEQPAHHHLKLTGLFDFFDTIVAGDKVAATKPDPTPYLTGAANLGVAATDCVAFEDSDTGTTAATRAGCLTFQVPDLRPVDKPLPDLGQIVVENLGEAAKRLGILIER